jgi:hypothetical protein
LPTLLELVGAPVAEGEMHGRSLASIVDSPSADEVRVEQYYELAGDRGLYRDGWEIVTRHERMTPFGDHEWELYNVAAEMSQVTNLAAEHPDRVAELAAAWEAAAQANQVYPLDEGSRWRYVIRPPHDKVFDEPVTIWSGTPTLERWRSSRLIWSRNCTITIAFTMTELGDRGMLVAHGDQGGGYAVYVDNGRVHFTHNNGYGQMSSIVGDAVGVGEHVAIVSIEAPGGFKWNVGLAVDGGEATTVTGLAAPFPMAPFEGIDVGIDRRSPVSWEIYQRDGTFAFSGKVKYARYEPGELAPDAGDRWIDFLKQAGAKFE